LATFTSVRRQASFAKYSNDGLVVISAVKPSVGRTEPQRVQILGRPCEHRPHAADLERRTIGLELSAQLQPIART